MSTATLIAVGTLAAQIAIGFIFRAKPQDTFGPRVSDLQLSSSAYFEDIPKGYGTGPIAGHMLWMRGNSIDERTNTEKVGGGKGGGGSPTHTTYSYFLTGIYGFGFGPASGVRRIRADGKLIFDVSGDNDVIAIQGLNFTFYPGSETQTVDPDYLADQPNAPPLRGEAYIKFVDLPLASFGNRPPNIEAELVFETAAPTNAYSSQVFPGGMGKTAASEDALHFDYLRGRLIANDLAGLLQVAGAFDADDFSTIFRGGVDGVPEYNWICGVGADGTYYGVDADGANENVIYDAITGLETDRDATSWDFPRSVQPFRLVTGVGNFTMLAGGKNAIATLGGQLAGSDTIRTWDADLSNHKEFLPFGTDTRLYSMTERGDGTGRLCFLVYDNSDASSLNIYQLQIAVSVGTTGGLSPEVSGTLIGSIAATAIESGASAFTIGGSNISHDRPDDTLILSFELDSDPAKQYVIKWSETAGIIWKTGPLTGSRTGNDPLISHRENGSANRLIGRSFAWVNYRTGAAVTDLLTQINLGDGSIAQNAVEAGGLDGNNDGDSIWDDETGRIYNTANTTGMLRGVLNLLGETGASVASIYQDRCELAGIDIASEFNAAAVSDTIDFYAVTRRASERSNIEPLMAFFGHSAGVEDDVLEFITLGGAVAGTILETDMLPGRDGDPIEVSKTQASELPARLTVSYADKDHGFERGAQSAQRITAPLAATPSGRHVTLSLQAGMTATKARQGAERGLIRAWNERDELTAPIDIENLEYSPGVDSLTVSRLDGSSQRVRISSYELGADYSIEASFVGEEAAQFVDDPNLASDAGDYVPEIINATIPSELLLMNMPVLRNSDAVADRSFSRTYYGVAPVSDKPWGGALVYKLAGDTEFQYIESQINAVAWGRLSVVPPATDEPWHTSKGSFFEAVMVTGFDDLASVSRADLYNGVNVAFVFKRSGANKGRGELIFYQNFTDLGGTRGRFTDLIRGEHGTEVFMADIAVGDTVAILSRATVDDLIVDLAKIDVSQRWRAVTAGQLFELGTTEDFVSLGDDLRAWHPAKLAATQSGGDIIFTWTRRTHYGGNVFDATGSVPLNQDTEEYKIEIFDGPGGTLVRTVTGIASETYTYTSADQTTDGFGATPDPIDVKLYQVSAQVGDGFSEETSVPTT